MLARPVIYVNRITNLSDARYCAGMGVDMLGFVVDPGHADFVSPTRYQELIGWVAGPKRVAEITGGGIRIAEVIDNYQPDLLHISISTASEEVPPGAKIILEIPFTDLQSLQTLPARLSSCVEFVLITELPGLVKWDLSDLPSSHSLLLNFEQGKAWSTKLLMETGAAGLALQGSHELTPGLKDYDHLASILEELNN